ncbi:DUF6493 family protein [Streptomyces sp. NPDC059247]|uniref:DUF7824 domain-containing protein n=1 Tax=Streptomyces sp. NPDC059247 TaxID=3346790 RepID=UPI00369926B6
MTGDGADRVDGVDRTVTVDGDIVADAEGTGGTAAAGTAAVGTAAVGALIEAVRAGRAKEVPALLAPLDAAARRAALTRLKALRSEVRSWEWRRWNEASRIRRALHVAGAGCHPGAAAAATWLGARDLLNWRQEDGFLVMKVMEGRDAEWLADVAGRLAARPAVAESCYGLIHALVERSGCAVPATDGYVLGWARDITGPRLLERLRADPHTPVLVAHALAMAETPEPLAWSGGPDDPAHWPTALSVLVAEGVLDRARVVDLSVSRLLRGGRPRNLRCATEVLRVVAPDAAERRERVADWVAMASDGPGPVAGYAQEVLAGLAAEGALSAGVLAEMTAGVLFRTEKKLVRFQLTLVGKALAREPDAAGELLPALAEAFGHEDTVIQERALKLTARHLSAVDPSVRSELAERAGLLSPVHRETAVALFGEVSDEGAGGPYEEILPPVPAPEPVAAPPSTVEELVEELLVKELGRDAERFERALDGLVRLAHRDRAAVGEAVREAFPTGPWEYEHYFAHATHDVRVVLAGLLGMVPESLIAKGRAARRQKSDCFHQALTGVTEARLWEAAELVGTDALPFLLASPTLASGQVDPLVLVERLREYRDAGVEPAPADFAQALLRVGRTGAPAARAAEEAAALRTAAGARLATWLGTAEPVGARVRFFRRDGDRSSNKYWLIDRLVVEVPERPVVREEFPPAFRWLGGELHATPRRCHHWIADRTHWTGVLPVDRETLAAAVLPSLAVGMESDQTGATEPLTALAEADGPVGRAASLALALGLGCLDADDRLRAVDALLVLAARGDLDAGALGTELSWLVTEGSVKPNRLADALRTAAATGAYGTVWAVLSTVLPELLGAVRPVRGLGEVLAVAADCVERCGAGGEVAGLEAVASGRGASQFVVQARRLLGALRQGADQTPPRTV